MPKPLRGLLNVRYVNPEDKHTYFVFGDAITDHPDDDGLHPFAQAELKITKSPIYLDLVEGKTYELMIREVETEPEAAAKAEKQPAKAK